MSGFLIDIRRRQALRCGFATSVAAMAKPVSAIAHASFGAVEPRLSLPAMEVTRTNGVVGDLTHAIQGRLTALQLMYTGCSALCPIQGAMFAQLQHKLLAMRSEVQLLSLSIDPRGDDLPALKAWLAKHGARADKWSGLLPRAADLDRLQDVLKGRARGADRHTPQVYVLDRQGRLMYRTEEIPSVDSVCALLQGLAARA